MKSLAVLVSVFLPVLEAFEAFSISLFGQLSTMKN